MTRDRIKRCCVPRTYLPVLGVLSLFVGLAAAGAGCGGGHGMAGGSAFGMLDPQIQAMNNRLATYFETVQGNLADIETGGLTPSEIGAGSQEMAWASLETVKEEYGRWMHARLNALGETAAFAGKCWMMMGDAMIGPYPEGGGTCPCAPYMNQSVEELNRHLSEMSAWMQNRDPSGIPDEMNAHWGAMSGHLMRMRASMQQMHGSSGHTMGRMH